MNTAHDKRDQGANVAKPGVRLHFLDGLRALASLYVVLFHASTARLDGEQRLSWPVDIVRRVLGYGHFSVVFFIVLSGFSLMLPIARSGRLELVGGFRRYLGRRAKRILPAYYAALLLALTPLVALSVLGNRLGLGSSPEGALEPGAIISHLFLVHNLDFDWAYRINGPAWSVATEWQIYFVLPLVLLPLWRTAGAGVTVAFGWIIGSLPFFVLPLEKSFYWACPWFIGSFAMGMAGAMIFFSPSHAGSALRERAPWTSFALLSLAVVVAITMTGKSEQWGYPIVDFAVSVFAFCMIAAGAQRSLGFPEGRVKNFVVDWLAWKPLVYLGGFSYSLYLIQHPFLRLSEKLANRIPFSYEGKTVIHFVIVVPFILAMAWIFAEFFERPSTGGGIVLPALKKRFASGRTLPEQGSEPST